MSARYRRRRPRGTGASLLGAGLATVLLLAVPALLAPLPGAAPPPGASALLLRPDDASTALTISGFAAAPASVFLGETSHLATSVTGGSPPYAFNFTGLPSGCASFDTANLSCQPARVGTFSVRVNVTDSARASVHASTNLTVLVTNPLEVVLAFNESNVTAGQTVKIHPEVLGAVGPVAFDYPQLPFGCASSNTSTLLCTPDVPNRYTVSVSVRDALGREANDSRSLLVLPADLVVAAFGANVSSFPAGTAVRFSAVVEGAVLPDRFAYSGLPLGCPSVDTANLSCTPTEAGQFLVRLTVSDALGRAADASTPLDIANERPPTISAFAITPSNVEPGTVVTFSVRASGGIGPLSYGFAGLPAGCPASAEPAFQCLVNDSGSFTVTVRVSDANGEASLASSTLLVNAVPSSYAPHTAAQDLMDHWWMGAAAIVFGAALIAVAVGLLRRRTARRSPRP